MGIIGGLPTKLSLVVGFLTQRNTLRNIGGIRQTLNPLYRGLFIAFCRVSRPPTKWPVLRGGGLQWLKMELYSHVHSHLLVLAVT